MRDHVRLRRLNGEPVASLKDGKVADVHLPLEFHLRPAANTAMARILDSPARLRHLHRVITEQILEADDDRGRSGGRGGGGGAHRRLRGGSAGSGGDSGSGGKGSTQTASGKGAGGGHSPPDAGGTTGGESSSTSTYDAMFDDSDVDGAAAGGCGQHTDATVGGAGGGGRAGPHQPPAGHYTIPRRAQYATDKETRAKRTRERSDAADYRMSRWGQLSDVVRLGTADALAPPIVALADPGTPVGPHPRSGVQTVTAALRCGFRASHTRHRHIRRALREFASADWRSAGLIISPPYLPPAAGAWTGITRTETGRIRICTDKEAYDAPFARARTAVALAIKLAEKAAEAERGAEGWGETEAPALPGWVQRAHDPAKPNGAMVTLLLGGPRLPPPSTAPPRASPRAPPPRGPRREPPGPAPSWRPRPPPREARRRRAKPRRTTGAAAAPRPAPQERTPTTRSRAARPRPPPRTCMKIFTRPPRSRRARPGRHEPAL